MADFKWIGLTGGIASGKSTVANTLRTLGWDVVDADQLARDVVRIGTDGYREVVAEFGKDILHESGEINRSRLGEKVFADAKQRERLEAIIHPRVRAATEQAKLDLIRLRRRAGFYDVPLLFEKKMMSHFDEILLVASTPDVQLRRLIDRDGLSESQARLRLQAQIPIAQKVPLAHDVIWNLGSLEELNTKTREYDQKLREQLGLSFSV